MSMTMDRILRSLARNCYDYHVNEIFFAIDTEYSDYQVFSHTAQSTATTRYLLTWSEQTIRYFLTRSTATIRSFLTRSTALYRDY